MDTIDLKDAEDGWPAGPGQPGSGVRLPGRPRRGLLNRYTATLLALLTAAAGFYAGVAVEKSQTAPGAAGGGAVGGGAAGAAGVGATDVPGGRARRAAAKFAARFGVGATVGTVSSINGRTLYVTELSGDVVKVTLSSASAITKSEKVPASAVHPGDTVVIQGAKQANGSIVATSVSDSGGGGGLGALLGAGRFGAGASAGSGSSGGGLSSLFQAGG